MSDRASDLLEDGYSWTARTLLDDSEYVSRYEEILVGVLESASFQGGVWYTNMWPACRKEAENPAVLVLGRATRGQWAEKLDRRGFPAERAIDTAARKDMYWVDLVRSQYIRTALEVVGALPGDLRRNHGTPSLDISWSDLYKVARDKNPSRAEMETQGRLGVGELLTREVESLKPNLVLAFTEAYSHQTGEMSRGWFEDIMGPCSEPACNPNGIIRIARIADVPCIVCPHPQAGPARNRYVDEVARALPEAL